LPGPNGNERERLVNEGIEEIVRKILKSAVYDEANGGD